MDDIANQYRIIFEGAAGAGWIETAVRGRLRFDGADRVSFLQALLTNEIAALPPGSGTYSAYLTPQGRMIADLHVLVRPDCVMADVPAALASSLADTFDKLIFAEDVIVSNQSSAIRQLSVIGTRAPDLIARALAISGDGLRQLPIWSQLDAGPGFVVRTDDLEEGAWDVWLPVAAAGDAIQKFEAAGMVQVSPELFEALRIDEGLARFGVDMTTETIPLEAGLLDRAISQSKGCYVGQEVIVRVLHRGGGRIAKRLVRIKLDGDVRNAPAPGARITAGADDVGAVTSAAWSPRAGRVVALGYVSRQAAEAGRAVSIDGRTATINVVGGL